MSFGQQAPAAQVQDIPGDAYILDVREPEEWYVGHAPDAIHIPLGELHTRASEVPAQRDVYVVCRSGGRSAQATAFLNAEGYRATNVSGGMRAWAAADYPMVREESDDPPEVA